MTSEEMELMYQQAVKQMGAAKDETEYSLVAQRFALISDYKDSSSLQNKCIEKASDILNRKTYVNALSMINKKKPSVDGLQRAKDMLLSLNGWGDSQKQIELIEKKIDKINGTGNKSFFQRFKILIIVVSVLLVVGIGLGGYFLFFKDEDTSSGKSRDKKDNVKIEIPFDADDVVGNNDVDYRDVRDELEDAGFTNIEVDSVDDLITGLTVSKYSIESMSVGGDRDFREGDEFDPDVRIRIYYHDFR